MATISDEEFEQMYGRPPVKKKKRKRKVYWNRIIIALLLLIFIIFGIVQLVKSIAGHFHKEDKPAAVNSVSSDSSNDDEKPDIDEQSQLQFKVCIDAGHGDYDGGTANADNTRIEKDDNLRIALLVEKYLKEAGANVVMIRDDDSFIDLGDRCEIANKANADLFVSLHRNSYDGEMNGVEIWVHNKEPMEDTKLAQNIMTQLVSAGISNNRGVRFGYVGMPNDNYYVNADTKMPSCLVELGFITDESDNKLFDENIESYAKAIGDGIIQTAKDLGVIDEDGKRMLNKQLISEDKIYITDSEAENDSSAEDDNSSEQFPDDGHLYNNGENQRVNND